MQITHTAHRANRPVLCPLMVLVCLVGSLAGTRLAAATALGPCEPGLVKQWQPGSSIRFVAASRAAESAKGAVLLEWLGHSSFLLTSPGGLRLLTDPNGYHPPPVAPDVVTVSNLHATHTNVSSVSGAPEVLWGIAPDGTWNQIALKRQDVTLFNIPSYVSRTQPENSPVHSSIFVFHMGGLCIVHMGNLRHPLTPQQLQRIGKPDVMMVSIDGQWTMAYDDVVTVITQLQPRLVVPMHIDIPGHAEFFMQYTAGRYPVRRVQGHRLTLSRSHLPAMTEIVVFMLH